MNRFFIFLSLLFVIGCRELSPLETALQIAGDNRDEIEKVLDHYAVGSLKYQAAVYLIENMVHHYSLTGSFIDVYRDSLLSWNGSTFPDDIWRQICEHEDPEEEHLRDIQNIKADYLIQNVDQAFDIWDSIPWREEIDFERFCQYILPYKIQDEPIVQWRERLRSKYIHLIRGVKDQKQAYDVVYTYLRDNYQVKKVSYPFTRDAIMLDIYQVGECPARASYLVFVMRALGITAAYDFTPVWANYSEVDHAWAVYVDPKNIAYIIQKGDSCSEKYQDIDGTIERTRFHYDREQFPYHVDSLKKIAKIYRKTYALTKNSSIAYLRKTPPLLRDIYAYDVTAQYIAESRYFEVTLEKQINDQVYLCTYQQQEGWVPIGESSYSKGKQVRFEDIYHEVVCLPALYRDGVVVPISNPVIVYHNRPVRTLDPDYDNREKLVLLRKYMISSRWVNRWGEIQGSRFEMSDDKEFTNITRILFSINNIPIEKNVIQLDTGTQERFLRFIPAEGKYPVLAELEFYTTDVEGNKNKISHGIFSRGKGLDGDTLVTKSLVDGNLTTVFLKRFPHWIGIDLGHVPPSIREIHYYLWNDQNQIGSGDEYELFYYDYGWKSLGRQIATEDYLIYENAPKNSLFWLKNHTRGKEERIFTYVKEKQIWW